MPYVSTGASGVKDFVLSFVHVIVTLLFLVLLNMVIAWALYNPVFYLIEWFNHIPLSWKLMLLFIGGYIVVEKVLRLTRTTVIMNNLKG